MPESAEGSVALNIHGHPHADHAGSARAQGSTVKAGTTITNTSSSDSNSRVEGGCCASSKAWFCAFFKSHTYHVLVVLLVLLDLAFVVVDLSFSVVYCHGRNEPEAAHKASEVFAWGSIAILSIFVVEFALKLWSLGPAHFLSWAHMLDVVVVVASLVLELVLRNSAMEEVAALLVVFRLWRLVRILHATSEIINIRSEEELHECETKVAALELDLRTAHEELQKLAAELEREKQGKEGATSSTAATPPGASAGSAGDG